MALASSIETFLSTLRFGRRLEELEVVDSSNEEAYRRGLDGAPEGSVVLAERQTKGRGRFARGWLSNPGENLTFSVILHPGCPRDWLGLIGLAAAVAVIEAVQSIIPDLPLQIKWPNDIVSGSRKLGGILPELHELPDAARPMVVLGIGLNVNQTTFPPSLSERAGSLCLESGKNIRREPLLAALLNRLERHYDLLMRGEGDAVREAFLASAAGIGCDITLFDMQTKARISGRFIGIDDRGAMRLRMGKRERTFHSGDVTFGLPADDPKNP